MKKLLCILGIFAISFLLTMLIVTAKDAFPMEIKDLNKGDILQLVYASKDKEMEWYGFASIRMRKLPSRYTKVLGEIFFWRSDDLSVEFLGEEKDGWIKVKYVCEGTHGVFTKNKNRKNSEDDFYVWVERKYFCGNTIGWVYGEFFGAIRDEPYVKFSATKTMRVKEDALGRIKPSFFSVPVIRHGREWEGNIYSGYTYEKGKILKIVGKKGNWYKTDEGLWVFHELLARYMDTRDGIKQRLLKICPDAWIENRMPRIISDNEASLPLQYFKFKGERRELTEFDVEWVQENCDLQLMIVW